MGFDPAKALANVDLTNKTILITGSTSGIGFATAQILVQHGAKVYLAARNPEKAASCIKRIEESLSGSSTTIKTDQDGKPKGQALFHQLDLSQPKDAKQSAEAFMQKEQKLDVLINCAAVTVSDYKIDTNGIEHLMNVNYLSPLVFTETILPLLKKTAAEPNSDVRIINVASDAHRELTEEFHFKSKDDFNVNFGNGFMQTIKRYKVSKLAKILWTRVLQRHLTEEGVDIIVIALHPGEIHTEAVNVMAHFVRWPLSIMLRFFAKLMYKNVLDGAGTLIIAAASPEVRKEADKYKGAYLVPIGKISEPSKQALDDELGKELWNTTTELVKEWGL